MKKIVSIQDISCYGSCSLTVALPILSAKGIETAILPSAILSTHTGGFNSYSCLDLTDEMPKIIQCWIDEKIKFDAVYTGYIGDARQFDLIRKVRDELLSPGGKLIVDPAMADHGKIYKALDDDIVCGMKEIVREADMILPNLTEAALLLGREYREDYSRDEIIDMLKGLAQLGPDTAVITGVCAGTDRFGAAAYCRSLDSVTEYYAQKQERNYHGTGDIFASVLIADHLNDKPIGECLEDACEFVVKSIRATLPHPEHGYGVMFEEVLAGNDL